MNFTISLKLAPASEFYLFDLTLEVTAGFTFQMDLGFIGGSDKIILCDRQTVLFDDLIDCTLYGVRQLYFKFMGQWLIELGFKVLLSNSTFVVSTSVCPK